MIKLEALASHRWRPERVRVRHALDARQRLLEEPVEGTAAVALKRRGDGRTVAVAGFYVVTETSGVACAWLLLGERPGAELLSIVRFMRAYIEHEANNWRVLRAAVPTDQPHGRRLAALLGFSPSQDPALNDAGLDWFELRFDISHALH